MNLKQCGHYNTPAKLFFFARLKEVLETLRGRN